MASYRQDIAPVGGYKAIEWAKVEGKKINGYRVLGGFLVVKAFGLAYWYLYRSPINERKKLELNDSRIALLPFFHAEDDRLFLKKLRFYREQEAELMKDVPNWKVGTWKGEPLYHTKVMHPGRVNWQNIEKDASPLQKITWWFTT